jgi:hypothetical protein
MHATQRNEQLLVSLNHHAYCEGDVHSLIWEWQVRTMGEAKIKTGSLQIQPHEEERLDKSGDKSDSVTQEEYGSTLLSQYIIVIGCFITRFFSVTPQKGKNEKKKVL